MENMIYLLLLRRKYELILLVKNVKLFY